MLLVESKGDALPHKLWRLGGVMKCWASILTLTFHRPRIAKLSALCAGCVRV